MQKQPSGGFLKEFCKEILQNSRENICAGISFLIKFNFVYLQLHWKCEFSAGVFSCVFAKFVRTHFLQHTITARLILIIAVSIVVKGESANETVNYDTKTKAWVPVWASIKKGSPGERTGFRSSLSQMFFQKGALKYFVNSTEKHLCWSLFFFFFQAFIKNRLQHRYFSVNIANFLKARIHCEIFISDYFMKDGLMHISLHLIWFHETHVNYVKRNPSRTAVSKIIQKRVDVQFVTDRVYIF